MVKTECIQKPNDPDMTSCGGGKPIYRNGADCVLCPWHYEEYNEWRMEVDSEEDDVMNGQVNPW